MAKTLVFGHQNPDTDTIASAIGASYLLNTLYDQDTEAVALGTVNDETKFALDKFGVAAPRVIETADTEDVYLVDHNEAAQSVANIAEVNVLGIYDHHKFDFKSSAPLYITNKPWGSVATILFFEFKTANVAIPAEIAGLLASAVISDTLLLKSPTTTAMDKEALAGLAAAAGLDDVEAYGLALLKAGTDLSKKSEKELIDGDAKSFEIGGHTFRIGQVNTVDIDEVLTRQAALETEIKAEMAAEGYDNFLFVITDILNSNSKALYIGAETAAVEKAFDKSLTDNVIDLPGVVSRKKQVVPPLNEAF
ncbi:manganese-dependent inorganic pyrophosphatase [Weissella soli]|uniref:manganese-dependent inorganic pyrophosphatase n=1 Tax=Weissella soli TaxID=155866 RepID=UPI00359F90EC